MRRTAEDGTLIVSVCDPDLHIKEKTYTTPEPSAPSFKTLHLRGAWSLAVPNEKVKVQSAGDVTEITVIWPARTAGGIPIEEITGFL